MKSMVKNPWSRKCPKCLHREEIMKALCKRLGVLVLLAMAGCVSEPEPVGGGPYVNKPEFPPGMIEEVVRSSVEEIVASSAFLSYLEDFRASHDGRNPVVKVGRIYSDAPMGDKETLKTSLIRPFLAHLMSAGLVGVSDVEELPCRNHAIYEPSITCACKVKRPRVADLVLLLEVRFREEKEGQRQLYFELSMVDIQDGRIVWLFSVPKRYVMTNDVL